MTWFNYAAMAVQAMSSIAQGNAAHTNSKTVARQLEGQASRIEAASQRDAIEERRASRIISSHIRAVSGASGAGVDDPTVTNLTRQIDSRGEYNALMALYDGTMRGRDLQSEAQAKREEGRNARRAGYISAIAQTGESMWDQGTFNKAPKSPIEEMDMSKIRPYRISEIDTSKMRTRI